jgi:AmiR/NasT family two-component response regulator
VLDSDVPTVQALADVATIGILQERALRQSDVARAQLQYALSSRIVIEQAKGVVSYTHSASMDEAFTMIRQHARSNGLPLADVAAQIVDGLLAI